MQKWRQFSFSFNFSIKQLFRERGLVSRVLLMGIFLGIVAGMWSLNRETTEGPQRYLKTLDVDYWVTQAGADSLSSSSYVNPHVHDQLMDDGYNVDGTLVYFNKVNDRNVTYQSYRPGGPLDPPLKDGRQVNTDHEVVLDHVMAGHLGVGIGDTVRMVNDAFTVVGLSEQSNSVGKEIAFINHDALTRLVGSRAFQVLAIQLDEGQMWPPNNIDFTGYTVVTNETFLDSNLSYQTETYSPFFLIIIMITIIGLSFVLALALKREYDSKLQRFGLMKAIGASKSFLVGTEVVAMAIVSAFSAMVGVLIANLLTLVANDSIPGLTASIVLDDLIVGAVVAVIVSSIALASPVLRLYRLSPVQAMSSAPPRASWSAPRWWRSAIVRVSSVMKK